MHPAGERRVGGQRGVRGEVVARVVGGGQHLDAEPLEQGARPVGVLRQPLGDLVVDRRRRWPPRAARSRRRSRPAPPPASTGRGAAEHRPVLAQQPPRPRRASASVSGPRPDAELGQRHPGGVQQPGHVVVRGDEQGAGSGNGTSSTSMRASTWPCGDTIGRSRTASYSRRATARTPGIGRQQPVGVQDEGRGLAWADARRASRSLAIGCHQLPRPLAAGPRAAEGGAHDRTPARRRPRGRRRIGGPDEVLAEDEVAAFVAEQLAAGGPRRPQRLRGRPRRAPAAARCRCCSPPCTARWTAGSAG